MAGDPQRRSGDRQAAIATRGGPGKTRHMATRVDSRSDRPPDHHDLGTAIARYLRDAEAGGVRAFDGSEYSPAGLRSLRRTLDQVEAAVGAMGLADLRARDARE